MTSETSKTLRLNTRLLSPEERQRIRDRLRSRRLNDYRPQFLGPQLTRLVEDETITKPVEDLLAGRLNLQQSLLAVTDKAAEAIETALRDERRHTVKKTRINLQLEAGLLQGQAHAVGATIPKQRGSFVVQGQVLNEQSNKPLAGVLVQAIDRDVCYDDFLGVAVTDEEGRYSIRFRAQDFREGGEGQPEVLLQVGADLDSLMQSTEQPIPVESQKPVTVVIAIPDAQAHTLLEAITSSSSAMPTRLQDLHVAMAQDQLQHVQLQALGQALSRGLQIIRKNLTSEALKEDNQRGDRTTQDPRNSAMELVDPDGS